MAFAASTITRRCDASTSALYAPVSGWSRARPWLSIPTQASPFSTSPVLLKRSKGPKTDTRITLIRHFLKAPAEKTPRPLRFSRLRALRHWTIHRAWQLHKAQQRQSLEQDLERQYNAMRDACEQLRLIGDDGMPGGPNEGRLYRLAMEKKGVWQGVPIEYARLQTEWPSRDGWNHEWKRG